MIAGIHSYLRHLRPATNRFFSSVFLNVVLDEIAHNRSFSLDELAPRIFLVASFQAIGSFKKFCSSSLRKPMSTRTLTNSGKPAGSMKSVYIVRKDVLLGLRYYS